MNLVPANPFALARTGVDFGTQVWTQYPSECGLTFYEGDDVLVTLFFQDPDDPALDMSTWEWHAQVRAAHSYGATLVAVFSVNAVYESASSTTRVEMFLPRADNTDHGTFAWEVYSVAPVDFSRFPKPADVLPEDWPPPSALRTWLWGTAEIQARSSTTDVLGAP